MAEVTAAAYQDVRDHAESTWTHIEIRDDADPAVAVLRVDTTDPRVTWTHNAGEQQLELTCVLTGSDADVPLGTTVTESHLYNSGSGGDPLSSENLSPFTFNADADQLTIRHRIQVPQIA